MSAEAAALTRTWAVGKRYRCTLTVPRVVPGQQACASIEWDPAIPTRLSRAELNQYKAGRDAAIADLAAQLHITVAVVDL